MRDYSGLKERSLHLVTCARNARSHRVSLLKKVLGRFEQSNPTTVGSRLISGYERLADHSPPTH